MRLQRGTDPGTSPVASLIACPSSVNSATPVCSPSSVKACHTGWRVNRAVCNLCRSCSAAQPVHTPVA